ncbi:AraC family transcriptional regulator [Alkalihalobacillus sp. EGI L200015]|nr:AraC family transcriptional regulator [Pseudalkalibacillus salsuginis]
MVQRFSFLMQTDIVMKLPVYMVGVGHWDNQEPVSRPDGYPLYQFLYCIDGEGEFIAGNHRYQVKPGTGMFLYPDDPHEYRAVKEPWELYWLNFAGEQAETLVRLAGFTSTGTYRITSGELITRHMQAALTLALSQKSLAGLECSKLVYMLMIDIMKCIAVRRPSIEKNFKRLQPVFDYIEQHYTRRIMLEQLADTLGVSVKHLCLLFRQIMNIRPIEYLNLFRINKSKELLLTKWDARIAEIAHQVGFETPGYFGKLFKKTEGVTPEMFRRLNGIR